jgi:gamma-glutamylcyclotransferase (GGCT)/AIG2-like uncharacterized protein YtfP
MPLLTDPVFKLFTYGTLMRDGCRHPVLADQTFLGPAVTKPLYVLYDFGEHPGMGRRETGGRAVHGELYEVAAERLKALDEMEGSPDLFRLEPVDLEGWDGTVFSYFYQPSSTAGLAVCESGRWQNAP